MSQYFLPKYESWKFPTGEAGVRVEEFKTNGTMVLDYSIEKELMVWFQIIDSYNRHAPTWSRRVFIPYLPYSRQDRIHRQGESVSIDILEKIFEALEIDVMTIDPHSCTKWIARYIVPIISPLYQVFNKFNYRCYPDKNAENHGINSIWYTWPPGFGADEPKSIYMGKVRNPKNGDISLKILTENVSFTDSDNILINDDICDGGITFTTAAQLLQEKGAKNISLFVTHGLFNKGLDVLYESGIQHIYTTNSYCKMQSNEKLTVIDIFGEELNV
jgi:ribose-phosphate pyrophosphokinase